MENTLSFVTTEGTKTLIREIHEVCRQMSCTKKWFQMEEDDDMIDACIYQMEVLNARYRYLIRKARSENITLPPFLQKEAK